MGEFEAPEFDAVEPIDLAELADADFALGKAETEELDSLVERKGAPGAESLLTACLLYTSPSPRDRQKSRMPSSA